MVRVRHQPRKQTKTGQDAQSPVAKLVASNDGVNDGGTRGFVPERSLPRHRCSSGQHALRSRPRRRPPAASTDCTPTEHGYRTARHAGDEGRPPPCSPAPSTKTLSVCAAVASHAVGNKITSSSRFRARTIIPSALPRIRPPPRCFKPYCTVSASPNPCTDRTTPLPYDPRFHSPTDSPSSPPPPEFCVPSWPASCTCEPPTHSYCCVRVVRKQRELRTQARTGKTRRNPSLNPSFPTTGPATGFARCPGASGCFGRVQR